MNNKIRLVIDLHGCSRDSGLDISLDTIKENTSEKYLGIKKEILSSLKTVGYDGIVENAFKLEENCVTQYVFQKFHIPSYQIEINKKYRVPHQNGQSYCKLITTVIGIIQRVEKNL